jgi:hypothetical protein
MDGVSTFFSSEEVSQIEMGEFKTIESFTQSAAAIGMTTHCISLPSISDFSLDAISLFTEALLEVEYLFARSCELETRNIDQLNDGYQSQQDHPQGSRILILCPSSDWTTALAVAAALHIYVKGGGVRAAALALSMPVNPKVGILMLHPTDVARLTAWEARVLATAAHQNQRCRALV